MVPELGLDPLLDYTSWQREGWSAWFAGNPAALRAETGPHGDGRFPTVGDIVKHVFTVERRYVQRIAGLALTDFTDVAPDDVGPLFAAGRASRAELRQLLATYAGDWYESRPFVIPTYAELTASPRKIVLHTLVHEIRHWAQAAAACRIAGHVIDAQDVLASSVWGGSFTPADGRA